MSAFRTSCCFLSHEKVHQMVANSKDLVFADSSSNMEEFNLRVFVIVAHSVRGALPLGIIVTSDEQGETLKLALQMFKECVSSYGFYGSTKGPHVVMTDKCDELREALLSIWPNCILLCIFHILQQVVRWVHEKKNAIALALRLHLSKYRTVDEMEENYENFLSDEMIRIHSNLNSYIKNVYQDHAAWALCLRKVLPIRVNNTNNFCEAQFLVIKNDTLKRQKEVNIVGSLGKLVSMMEFIQDDSVHRERTERRVWVFESRHAKSKKKS